MMLPPAFLRVRVHNDQRRVRFWFPLVLLWPVMVLIAALTAPIVVVAAALYWHRGWGRPILLAGPLLLYVLFSLRGLRVDLASSEGRVFVSID